MRVDDSFPNLFVADATVAFNIFFDLGQLNRCSQVLVLIVHDQSRNRYGIKVVIWARAINESGAVTIATIGLEVFFCHDRDSGRPSY